MGFAIATAWRQLRVLGRHQCIGGVVAGAVAARASCHCHAYAAMVSAAVALISGLGASDALRYGRDPCALIVRKWGLTTAVAAVMTAPTIVDVLNLPVAIKKCLAPAYFLTILMVIKIKLTPLVPCALQT